MPTFDEAKQTKKLETLRNREEEELAKLLSEKYGLQYVDLTQIGVSSDALRLVPEERAKEGKLAVFASVGQKLSVGVQTPNNSTVAEVVGELKQRGYEPKLFMCSSISLAHAWKYYSEVNFATETKAGMIDISSEAIAHLMEAMATLEDARQELAGLVESGQLTLTSRILETIVAGGLALKASDIHIEPDEHEINLRYRLDGVLTLAFTFDEKVYRLLNSRIKLLSGLKINIKNAPQDGRFSVNLNERAIEIRTSILPGNYGESIVLRLLDPTSIAGELEELGMPQNMLEMMRVEIAKPNGMILNTGPTGSGKTTTLYAFLRRIHTPGIKIITIEDPVEYHLHGVVQTQVDHEHYTFAGGLRSVLRQDPDVIMLGEIRDHEVASTAMHAALTGHLVLSTLHTNNAAGAFPRLADIGIDRSILASSVNLAMAQRLVRQVVPEQCERVTLTGKRKAFVDEVLAGIYDQSLIPENRTEVWSPVVPEGEQDTKCYKGRIGVYEAVQVDEAVEEVIKGGGGTHDIITAAKPQGLLSMQEDAVVKALTGVTTMEEVERVLGSVVEG
ncbi:hypothetical protein GVX82_03180 [Patescibacteria group bacterium]|jgi:type II secretory ATPase GspE/PulE/Tfp pilus assembly ATPase PilB-like protein|nr:hypothetical protein [Patescibacteria group bacterium]